MSKINRIINAAIGATLDRKMIYKAAKGTLNSENIQYSKLLEDISGPKADTFMESVQRWKKAYNSNIERIKLIEELNAPFKKTSLVQNIINKLKNNSKC